MKTLDFAEFEPDNKVAGEEIPQFNDSQRPITTLLEPSDKTMSKLDQNVAQFYAGRDVFVTGGTGFVGKVLIYKLLHSCPQINRIYVLARPKRGKDIATRLKEIFDSKMFDKLRQEQPDFKQKVIAIAGDTMEPNLGMNEADIQTLTENVSVVVNSAATVRFDEPMKYAIRMNITSVKKMLELAKKMKKLEAFVHVSTAYANCDRERVDAKVYDPPMCPLKLMKAAEWMDDAALDAITPQMIGKRPNTYTYTKAAAESLVEMEADNIPVAIVRPSIIGGAVQEPMPGWVDNFNGPTGLFVANGKGIMRLFSCKASAVADIIPVDHCVNQIIVTAWNTALERPGLKVYHNTTGGINPIHWGDIGKNVPASWKKYPLNSFLRTPHVYLTTNPIFVYASQLFDHYLPAVIIDGCSKLMGKKPLFTKIQTRLWNSINTLAFFTNNHWWFNPDTQEELFSKLSDEDRKKFSFDVSSINWKDYIENYVYGSKVYAMKEDPTSIPAARKSAQKVHRREMLLKIGFFTLLFRLLSRKSSGLRFLWLQIFSFVLLLLRNISVPLRPYLTQAVKRLTVV